MNRYQRICPAVLATLLCLLLGSCSRPGLAKSASEAGSKDARPVPFQNSDENASTAPFQGQAAAPGSPSLPLGKSHATALPAGTLLTVRLEDPISADRNAHGVFSAVVDEPVVVDGNVLVARGAGVVGRVESGHFPAIKGNRCCVRLTLNSIDISGKDFPIQTSTLFAHRNGGNADPASSTSPDAIRLTVGRRLTFRLAQATYVAGDEVSSR